MPRQVITQVLDAAQNRVTSDGKCFRQILGDDIVVHLFVRVPPRFFTNLTGMHRALDFEEKAAWGFCFEHAKELMIDVTALKKAVTDKTLHGVISPISFFNNVNDHSNGFDLIRRRIRAADYVRDNLIRVDVVGAANAATVFDIMDAYAKMLRPEYSCERVAEDIALGSRLLLLDCVTKMSSPTLSVEQIIVAVLSDPIGELRNGSSAPAWKLATSAKNKQLAFLQAIFEGWDNADVEFGLEPGQRQAIAKALKDSKDKRFK